MLPHHDILVFSSSICIKLPIRVIGVQVRKTHLFHHFYMLIQIFVLFASFTFLLSWIKSFFFPFDPSNFAQKCTQKPFSRVFFSIPFSTSSANPYRMLKQSEGSVKRKKPYKGSSSDNTARALVRIVDDFATNEFRRDFNIPNNADIQLLRNTTPIPTDTHKKHSMCFTRKQFHVELCLPLPSLVREFLHYTQIPLLFVHSNLICIITGCSVLN